MLSLAKIWKNLACEGLLLSRLIDPVHWEAYQGSMGSPLVQAEAQEIRRVWILSCSMKAFAYFVLVRKWTLQPPTLT
jgi:hypothetical protein